MVVRNAPQPLRRADGNYDRQNEQEVRDEITRALNDNLRRIDELAAKLAGEIDGLSYLVPANNLDDVDDAATALANIGGSPLGHTHDDRYYTESETNTLLSNKSDVGHIHDDRYYTESEIDAALAGKSDVGHIHDDRYYTETESDARFARTLASGTVSNGATLNVDFTTWTGFSKLELRVDGLQPVADNVMLHMRFSTDGGANWLTTGYNYSFVFHFSGGGGPFHAQNSNQAQAILCNTTSGERFGNAAGEHGMVIIEIPQPAYGGFPLVRAGVTWMDANARVGNFTGGVNHNVASAWNALQLYFDSGNINTARWRLIGTP